MRHYKGFLKETGADRAAACKLSLNRALSGSRPATAARFGTEAPSLVSFPEDV